MAINWGALGSHMVDPTTGVAAGTQMAGGILAGIESTERSAQSAATTALTKAQTENVKAQAQEQQAKAYAAPHVAELGIKQQEQDIAKTQLANKATIASMGAAQLQQKVNQMGMVNQSLGALQNVHPEDLPAAYDATIQKYKQMGIPTDGMPEKFGNNPYEAKNAIKTGFAQSKWGLQKFQSQLDATKGVAVASAKGVADIEKAQLEAKLKGGEALAGAEAAQYVKYTGITSDQATAAAKQNENLDLIQSQLKNLAFPTGPVSGWIDTKLPSGQTFKMGLIQLQGEYIKDFHLGRMTQLEFNFLRHGVVNESMPATQLVKMVDYFKAKNEQAIQKTNFIENLSNKGIAKKGTVEALWNRYLSQNSLISKEGNVNKSVVTGWKKYTTPEMINKAKQGFENKPRDESSWMKVAQQKNPGLSTEQLSKIYKSHVANK